MEPPSAELELMTTLDKVFQWAQFSVDDMDNKDTVSGSLADLLGIKKTTATKLLGLVSEADFEATIQMWKVVDPPAPGENPTGRRPSLAEYGAAKLVGHICRVHSGAGMTVEQLRSAAAKSQAPQAATPSSSSPTASRKLKLSTITSQVDETEINVADEAFVMQCYVRYQQIFGKGEMPPKDTEPTGEQISAIRYLLDNDMPPYADFSVYGPYSQRMQKRIKLSGVTISRDGVLRTVELQGPPTIAMWVSCYKVLANTLVMLNAVDLGALMKYESHIIKLHDRYSEKIWGVLYQAEVRCRLELM